MKRKGSSLRGFTIVELLVVIGVIALLVSILIPVVSKAQNNAKQIRCAANLRQLGHLWLMYANDNRSYFIDCLDYGGTWEIMKPAQKERFIRMSGTNDGKVFYCPLASGYSNAAKEANDASMDWSAITPTTQGDAYSIGYAVFAHNGNALGWNRYFTTTVPMAGRPNLRPPVRNNEKELTLRPLLMDTILRRPGEDWTSSNHFDQRTRFPAGGNAVFGDGHVAWRPWGEHKWTIMIDSENTGFERRW